MLISEFFLLLIDFFYMSIKNNFLNICIKNNFLMKLKIIILAFSMENSYLKTKLYETFHSKNYYKT